MFKVLTIILSLNLLVASQDLLGDGLGGLFALNMISGGRSPLGNLFGMGRPAAYPQVAQVSNQGGASGNNAAMAAAMAAAAARRQSPMGGGLANLFLFDAMGIL